MSDKDVTHGGDRKDQDTVKAPQTETGTAEGGGTRRKDEDQESPRTTDMAQPTKN